MTGNPPLDWFYVQSTKACFAFMISLQRQLINQMRHLPKNTENGKFAILAETERDSIVLPTLAIFCKGEGFVYMSVVSTILGGNPTADFLSELNPIRPGGRLRRLDDQTHSCQSETS